MLKHCVCSWLKPYSIFGGTCRQLSFAKPKVEFSQFEYLTNIDKRNYCPANKLSRFENGPNLKDFIDSSNRPGSEIPLSSDIYYTNYNHVKGDNRKVYIAVFGCQMNVNDTEIVLSVLEKSGFIRTKTLTDADVILIMTCSIREGAEQKIWNRLEDYKSLKVIRKKSQEKFPLKIGILGCMAERLKTKILEREEMVDLLCGPDAYRDLPRLLAITESNQSAANVQLSLEETYADISPVRLNPSSTSAFVSIMRGCDNMCSYCIVPFTRGRERSRPMVSICNEVRNLYNQGVKEVILLGQNVNSYRDISVINNMTNTNLSDGFSTVYKSKQGGLRFADLLERISHENPEMRIRFTSPHPKDFPNEVLYLIRERPNICNNLHLPAQSGNNTVLENMRRGYTREAYLKLVDHVRDIIPNVSLSSDFISGFCGESEAAHKDTISLIQQVKYNYCFTFSYSMREKTRAFHRLVDNVPDQLKNERTAEVQNTFRQIAGEIHKSQIGVEQLVLVEGVSKRSNTELVGRNDGNTKVIFPHQSSESINIGDFIRVKITDSTSQSLKGVPLGHSSITHFSNHIT